MIVQAVETVERNKKRCRQLVHQVMIIGGLLPLLQQSEMMGRPDIRRPLEGLEDTLRQTYMLVTSCQHGNIVYRLLMAGSQAQKFRDIRNKIDLYLRIYPLISHIDTRHLLSGGLDSRARHPSAPQPKASEDMPESFASPSNPDSRAQGSTSNDNDALVEVQAVTEPVAVEEQQEDGYGNAQPVPNRKHWFRWLVQWAQREPSTPQTILELIGPDQQSGGFTVFKFSQLAASTNNFSSHNVIGQGGYGKIYKGVLLNGVDVAIKIPRVSSDFIPCELDFENELHIIPKLQHENIIKLLGCCIEGDKRILVYEYMPRSLDNVIKELKAGVFLAWPLRFRIIEGIAQGSVYLHQHSRLRLVHGDLKPSNILLDCDMTPRITDFGMAEVLKSDEDEKETNNVKGTHGYVEAEYVMTQIISIKCDVYTFGITVLEIITAQDVIVRYNVDGTTERETLPAYAFELWSSGRAMELMDPSLRDEPRISEILRCMQIALLCVQHDRADRPTMSDVLMMLKYESVALPTPRAPNDTSGQGAGDSSSPDGGEAERSATSCTST